jgi:FAD/FMN-containing dehydrogenase
VSVDVVTADGRVRTANECENPDLLWAIRGAGSNFGVVTSFEFRLHEVGPLVTLAAPFYALEDAERVLPAWRDFIAAVPDEIGHNALLWSVPAVDTFPAELHGRPVVILVAVSFGPAAEGERLLRPLRELATPLLDLSGAIEYTALQTAFDPFFPRGWRYYWKSTYLDDLAGETMAATIRYARHRPTSQSLVALWHVGGGAASRVGAAATAFGRRDSPFLLSFDTTWTDPADTERCIAWTRAAWAGMRPFGSGGVYLNFGGFGEEKEDLVRAAYGANYDRLVELKTKYDPTNLFRMNQNIRPSA